MSDQGKPVEQEQQVIQTVLPAGAKVVTSRESITSSKEGTNRSTERSL